MKQLTKTLQTTKDLLVTLRRWKSMRKPRRTKEINEHINNTNKKLLKKRMKPNEQQIHTNVKSTKPYYIVMKTILQYCTVLYSYCTIVYCTVVCAQKHLRGTASQPASQPTKQPAGRPAKNEANTEASRQPAGWPAGRPKHKLSPAGRARNSRTSSPRSLCFSNVFIFWVQRCFLSFPNENWI